MMRMRMLVSVRDVAEARIAARSGADFIDLKEPRDGALGGLPVDAVARVVQALREQGSPQPISATIGDLPMNDLPAILARVEAVAACGVDYVKVGIERETASGAVLDALAATGHRIIPVFIADRGLDFEQVAHACALKFPGMMVDTADKLAGSLFDLMPVADLRRFVARVRASGALVGLAGALRHAQLPALQELAPDFAGFRSAVCAGDRSGALDPERLRELAARLRAAPAPLSA
ncbi:(5-formylfuran-3-yl)methyl phosphate synthase [Ideonella azotifigens]|uniref:(5-formylfuran-3-yl)methyl phosphate synthase n=1 Tax=Ideonella azotifigens TaxID=513160 RepID=A0ABN1JZA2_9BURK|nr:(5-formylfuran-3-yl)methyl phosphate synthase [Ideonella azotifigens]MCD2342718.1 (5-formylfuran-3-yl)methyl phosphate synthase [Ideonella azotifigens]